MHSAKWTGGLDWPLEIARLTNMPAYQAESDLLRLVAPHYRRAGQEGRTVLRFALASAADLHIPETGLRVTLPAQISPHRTRAIAALSKELNETHTIFPGSPLRVRYAIREAL